LSTPKHCGNWPPQATGTSTPVILDPTAGGGSIPFEAGRLGFATIANELNPVAAFILRATCDWPQRYGYPLAHAYASVSERFLAEVTARMADVYPDEQPPDCAGGNCPHPQRVNDEHGTVRAQRYAQTYLWARTVGCPECSRTIPLSPNWRLDSKGTGIGVVADIDSTTAGFKIFHDRAKCPDCRSAKKTCNTATLHPDGRISEGTVARAIATCPWPDCGRTTPKGYPAAEAQAGRMGHQMYCVVYRDSWKDKTKSGRPKKRDTTFRGFAEITPERDNSRWVAEQLAERAKRWEQDDILPNEPVPVGNDRRPHTYGMSPWKEMFSPRQQLAHGICVEAFRDLVEQDRQAGELDELRKAAWGYVALAFDKLLNRNSLMSRWMDKTGVVVGTFDSHDFGFKWSYAEMVVANQGYGVQWALSDVGDCLSELCRMAGHPEPDDATTDELFEERLLVHRTAPPTTVINGPAQYTDLDDNSIDAVVIDPPYHDNVCYAELSDFFYVWLKRTAGHVFPEHFTDYLTDKVSEAIASPARFRDRTAKRGSARQLATQDYYAKMQEIFVECRRVIKDNGIMTVMFTHKRTDAWNALTLALIEAGFTITRTWPVKTEAESSMHIRGKAAARSTILLVCRPKSDEEAGEPADWTSVQRMITEAVRNDLDHLAQYDLAPLDTYLASYGTALKVISQNWGTQRATANPDRPEDPFSVTAEDALALASRQVMQFRAQQISAEWHSRGADPATRFYVLLSDAVPNSVVPYDEARLFAQAADVELDDRILKHYLHKQGDKVHILGVRERLARRIIGRDRVPRNTLDEVHTAMAIAAQEDTAEAATWLDFNGIRTENNDFQYTLEALLRTYKPGHPDLEPARNLWQTLYGARRWDTASLFETAD
jgi:adenine-specific DNA methylase